MIVEHAAVFVEDLLRTVAVVHVPVEDGHALRAALERAPPPAATATELKKQKPSAQCPGVSSAPAWWPGGRTSAKATGRSGGAVRPASSTSSAASITQPHASRAAASASGE